MLVVSLDISRYIHTIFTPLSSFFANFTLFTPVKTLFTLNFTPILGTNGTNKTVWQRNSSSNQIRSRYFQISQSWMVHRFRNSFELHFFSGTGLVLVWYRSSSRIISKTENKHWHFIIFQKAYWHMFHLYLKIPEQEGFLIIIWIIMTSLCLDDVIMT